MTEHFPDYAQINRAHWNRQAPGWAAMGRRGWSRDPDWGIWDIPNADLPLLPGDMSGWSAIELGCGTAYISAWMARRGATVVGIDPSENQLETARQLEAEHQLGIELIHGVAESVPKDDAAFDFAISEYGAAIWADPYVWIPEAWRLLKPGGQLAFLGNGSWASVCQPWTEEGLTGETMHLDYFGMHRLEFVDDDDPSVEFNLPVGEWFRLFKETGFTVEDFWEIQAPPEATGTRFFTTAEWSRRYPSEQAWRLRKAA